MNIRQHAVWVLSGAALVACHDESRDMVDSASVADAAQDSEVDAEPSDDADIIIPVDGSGDCGDLTTKDGPKRERACCGGSVCEGRCYLADGGGSYCGCGHIRGGCADGLICCAFTSSTCTLPENCRHF
ncbi:hypothetical protein BH09MYX1_BH09MYX1_17450 [soil metagenome]